MGRDWEGIMIFGRSSEGEGLGIAYLQSQIFTKLSLPPVTKRLLTPGSGLLLTKLPGLVAGAQLTALTPSPCAGKI